MGVKDDNFGGYMDGKRLSCGGVAQPSRARTEHDFQRDKYLDDILSSLDMESSTSLLEAREQAVAT